MQNSKQQNSEITKQRKKWRTKKQRPYQNSEHYKTANITKQQTLQNRELTKQRNHKTAKNKMENNKTANNKTATITKQRTLQNSEHNKTAIITK